MTKRLNPLPKGDFHVDVFKPIIVNSKLKRTKEQDKFNETYVLLKTDEGLARDLNSLKEVWDMRLKENAPHYNFVVGVINKNKGKPRI